MISSNFETKFKLQQKCFINPNKSNKEYGVHTFKKIKINKNKKVLIDD